MEKEVTPVKENESKTPEMKEEPEHIETTILHKDDVESELNQEVNLPEDNKPEERKDPRIKDPNESYDLAKVESMDSAAEEIEVERRKLLAAFNETKKWSRIIMVVVVLAVIAAIVLITFQEMALKITGYSIAGVVLVGMLTYYFITKDKFPKASRLYIAKVTDLINGYVFSDSRYSELKCFPNKKLTKTEFDIDRVYKDTNECGSRNFITGKFNKTKFEISENVLYSLSGDKRPQRKVAFLGKYVSLENKYKFDGRFIFNLKGEGEKVVDQPTDIEDCKVILEEGNLVVYSSNDKAIKEVFGTKFVSSLKNIQINTELLNLVIVAWAGHTGIYLSYDDSVTVLPFEHEFKRDSQDKFVKDLIEVLELMESK